MKVQEMSSTNFTSFLGVQIKSNFNRVDFLIYDGN